MTLQDVGNVEKFLAEKVDTMSIIKERDGITIRVTVKFREDWNTSIVGRGITAFSALADAAATYARAGAFLQENKET